MYRIVGADRKQYGPVTAEQVREWIAERRANGATLVQLEGTSEWRPLSSLPEFHAALGSAGASQPPPLRSPESVGPRGKISRMAITALVLSVLGLCSAGLTALAGLILGIAALVRIAKRPQELRGKGLAIAAVCTGGAFLFLAPIAAALWLPALAKARSKAQTIACLNHMKQIALAARNYADSHGNKLPPAQTWCDAIQPQIGSAKTLRCPAERTRARCSYAMNANLGGVDPGQVDPQTVLFFESDAGWNGNGDLTAMLMRPRHGSFVVALADGSVRQIPKERALTLRWDP